MRLNLNYTKLYEVKLNLYQRFRPVSRALRALQHRYQIKPLGGSVPRCKDWTARPIEGSCSALPVSRPTAFIPNHRASLICPTDYRMDDRFLRSQPRSPDIPTGLALEHPLYNNDRIVNIKASIIEYAYLHPMVN